MKIAISIGDLNGIGIEIALKSHKIVSDFCNPIYIVSKSMLEQACKLLKIKTPPNFKTLDIGTDFKITPSHICGKSGKYSFDSFKKAVELAKEKKVDAICTLPIHKKAWQSAGIKYKGHTDALKDIFEKETIMMIGCDKLFVALFTHHIALKDVPSKIDKKSLSDFMLNLYSEIKEEKIGVLGLNPHAGDEGVIGDEEIIIKEAINLANKKLLEEIFIGPLVPDTAFTAQMIKNIKYFVCMYHDQGLIAVKSLFFDESINVTLNLPIIRTSVDHGTAFDKSYKNQSISNLSYLNAVKEAVRLANKRKKFKI